MSSLRSDLFLSGTLRARESSPPALWARTSSHSDFRSKSSEVLASLGPSVLVPRTLRRTDYSTHSDREAWTRRVRQPALDPTPYARAHVVAAGPQQSRRYGPTDVRCYTLEGPTYSRCATVRSTSGNWDQEPATPLNQRAAALAARRTVVGPVTSVRHGWGAPPRCCLWFGGRVACLHMCSSA